MATRKIRHEIELTGEQKYKSALTNIGNELKSVAARQALLNAQFDAGGNSLARNVQQQELLRQKLTAQQSKLQAIAAEQRRVEQAQNQGTAALTGLKTQHDQLTAALQAEQARMQTLRAEYEASSASEGEASEATQALRQAYDSAGKTVEDLQKQLQGVDKQYSATSAAVEKNGARAQQLARDYDYAAAACMDTDRQLKELNQTISRTTTLKGALTAQIQAMGKDLDQTGQKISQFGGKMTMGITVPVTAGLTAAGKSFLDFEDSIAKLDVITQGQVGAEKLGKDLLQASNEVRMGVEQLSEAQYQAISAGIDAGDSMKYTAEAAKAAKAGFSDVTTVVNGSTSILNAWQMEASRATKVFDQMILAQDMGKTTLGEISSNIGQLTGLAPGLNVSLEEILASLVALTKAGVSTSSAVNGLKNIMSGVLKPTTEAKEAASKMGLEFGAAAIKAKGFAGFLQDVVDKTGGSEEKFAQLFGSVEGLSSALLLAGTGAQDFSSALTAMETASGNTERAFQRLSSTRAEQLKSSLNQLKNSGIQFGQALAPAVDMAAGALQRAADAMSGLTPDQMQFAAGLAMTAAAAGPVVTGIGNIVSAGAKLGTMVKGLSGLVGGGGTLGLITLGITGIGAALVTLKNHMDSLRGENQLKAAFGTVQIDTTAIDNALQGAEQVEHELQIQAQAKIELTNGSQEVNNAIIEILTDGKYETQQDKERIKSLVDEMLQPVYDGITEGYEEKKQALDEALASGSIGTDQYETRLKELKTATDETKSSLDTEREAYVSYVLTLCEQGKKPTEDQLAQLEELRQKIVDTGASITDAQNTALLATKSGYSKVAAGMGTEADVAQGVTYLQTDYAVKLGNLDSIHQQTLGELQAKLDSEELDATARANIMLDMQTEDANYQESLSELQGEYQQGIQQMMDGLAQQFPEQAERLAEVVGKQDLVMQIRKAMEDNANASSETEMADANQRMKELYNKVFPDDPVFEDVIPENYMTKAIETLKTQMTDEITNSDFSGIFTSFSTALGAGALDNMDLSGVEGTLSNLITAFDLADDGKTVGEQIINGEIKGIAGKQSELNAAILDSVMSGNTTLCNAQGIKSPSTVWAGYGQNLMQGMANGIRSSQSAVTAQVRTLSTGLNTLGRDSINGLINGANSRRAALINTYRSIANAALSAAKQALDSHSPSKKFEQVGRDTGSGMILGVRQKIAEVQNVMREMADPSQIMAGTGQTASGAESGRAPISTVQQSITVQYTGAVNYREARKASQLLGKYQRAQAAAYGG